ncbi:hypothetical protein D3C76_1831700 [compost metagenome]
MDGGQMRLDDARLGTVIEPADGDIARDGIVRLLQGLHHIDGDIVIGTDKGRGELRHGL